MTSTATSSAAGTIRNAIRAHPAIRACTMPHGVHKDNVTQAFMVKFIDGKEFFLAITEVQDT